MAGFLALPVALFGAPAVGYLGQAARARSIEQGGDIQAGETDFGTRGRPSTKDGRISDYGHHYGKWLRETQRMRSLVDVIKKDN